MTGQIEGLRITHETPKKLIYKVELHSSRGLQWAVSDRPRSAKSSEEQRRAAKSSH